MIKEIELGELKKAKEKKERNEEKTTLDKIYDMENAFDVPRNEELTTKLKVIADFMKEWTDFEKKNSKERHILLIVFCIVLSIQLLILNIIIFFRAFDLASNISENFLKWFITEVFAQVLGVVYFMVRYLYNNTYDKIMKAVLSLIQSKDYGNDEEDNVKNLDEQVAIGNINKEK